MNKNERCSNYTGLTCINAMAYEYPEYGYEHTTCEECGYYKGCEDCYFADRHGNCKLED